MPEKEIAALADRTGHRTFEVFANWMKENREAWERHLASQDRKLDEIHTEVKRTNRRVAELEKKDAIAEALAEDRRELMGEQRYTAEHAGVVRRWMVDALLAALMIAAIVVTALH